MGLNTVIISTDGSETAQKAALVGFAILQPAERLIVATVVAWPDEMTVTGTGIAGGTVTPGEFAELERAAESEGRRVVEQTAAALAPAPTELQVLRGDHPGPTLCDFTEQVSADALVMGSRGLGRIKRAVLGSVSDYVVRNASCPVIISGPKD